MSKKPKEKIYTQEECLKKAAKIRKMMKLFSKKNRKSAGKELFLNTDEGKVRVLAYNLENESKLPLFVNIHGGGFILGSPEMDDPYMMNVALNANVKIINVDYSLAPEAPFPKGVNECYAVVKYAQNNPQEFGINPQKIAVGGHSAGGNFSAAIGLKNAQTRELNIKGLILDYPPLDVYTDPFAKPNGKGMFAKMGRLFNACYCFNREETKNPLISPVYASKEQLKGFPPTLIITAGKDLLCSEAETFRDMLKDANIDVTHKRFESSPHGFTLSQRPDAKEAWQMMIDFLKRQLA
ncbi:MAG: alpha/beta hydrolase [Treponema sp.]|nr:alpha/beta hydrolase [Treponema sp.]